MPAQYKAVGLGGPRPDIRRSGPRPPAERRIRKHIKASRREEGGWNVFDKRYWPGEYFGDHLGFALRHEDLDLLVLKRLFEAVPQDAVDRIRAQRPDRRSQPARLVPL